MGGQRRKSGSVKEAPLGDHVCAPSASECFANIECRAVDTRLVNKYCLFVLEGCKAWIDPAQNDPKTIHHKGFGKFVVDGETIELTSKMP